MDGTCANPTGWNTFIPFKFCIGRTGMVKSWGLNTNTIIIGVCTIQQVNLKKISNLSIDYLQPIFRLVSGYSKLQNKSTGNSLLENQAKKKEKKAHLVTLFFTCNNTNDIFFLQINLPIDSHYVKNFCLHIFINIKIFVNSLFPNNVLRTLLLIKSINSIV